ncbi:MAG: aspartyl/glutamyl-tRNA amidotransferase subunit C [Anaerolineaceae bacterium]|jgi:aspartyl/glutamyl-tRNA(Asn/Gln) amidotransferase C subunit|nr:aspartyl/glutamyl-tRNA amidotransferase subunit C [Anaerolineaceae bacterium]MDD4042768.1 aspartyl/glutamyl-tRNA amidotransferase subunit C [Anaerolineaceae bacterium]MDD4578839.1 aspartyl/glutamyl-tRNA amidotransferase subunit C [Anaerolineaceae bacterium]
MTTKRISPELFEKLVGLAALELTAEESAYLFEEMNHQLASVEALSQIPLPGDIQPSLHGLEPQGAPPRPDDWQPFAAPEKIIALAPETEDGMIAVPDVKGAK